MTELTLSDVFAKRAEQRADTLPVSAAVWRAVADRPDLMHAITDDEPSWSLPFKLLANATELLRTKATDHPLADYWATLGGGRPADGALADAVADFLSRHADPLRSSWRRGRANRQNDPLAAAMFWPALTHIDDDRPLALIEMGGAAGLALVPDGYGYRYGDTTVNHGGAPVLECDWRGTPSPRLRRRPVIAARIGVERDPIRADDAEAIAWLRDCVEPDAADLLRRMDSALAHVDALDGIDWRAGDYFDELPAAIAAAPAGALAVVFGASTLCCAAEPERLAAVLADAGRDLVWISKEAPQNGLALVRDVADADRSSAERPRVLLTAVTYRAGRLSDVTVLATVDPYCSWIDWAPRRVEP
ncbi:MAG TPA: DUF2332 family protein [Stackebrandtia sp.]|jgi:hypothetical protein|uniref:DUF2332 family protein n=1 Tax=Stackebrandtia sp. TaxID=2023065 RepID=UPI002D41C800|nr:DUF2332 family protein [Stackebrandtia sp.]HZE41334.1 DUF2332 family protein [Stackebrandtia sp.]